VTYQICVPFERIKQEGYENNGVLNHFTASPASHTNNPECLSNNILRRRTRIRPTCCWKYIEDMWGTQLRTIF